jgi:hypothetical protein
MDRFHAVVWIDHDEAHVIHFNPVLKLARKYFKAADELVQAN